MLKKVSPSFLNKDGVDKVSNKGYLPSNEDLSAQEISDETLVFSKVDLTLLDKEDSMESELLEDSLEEPDDINSSDNESILDELKVLYSMRNPQSFWMRVLTASLALVLLAILFVFMQSFNTLDITGRPGVSVEVQPANILQERLQALELNKTPQNPLVKELSTSQSQTLSATSLNETEAFQSTNFNVRRQLSSEQQPFNSSNTLPLGTANNLSLDRSNAFARPQRGIILDPIIAPVLSSSQSLNSPDSISNKDLDTLDLNAKVPQQSDTVPLGVVSFSNQKSDILPSSLPTFQQEENGRLSQVQSNVDYFSDQSQETLNLYYHILAAEAGGDWDYDGVFLIAQTIVNRLNSGRFGATLEEVLTQKNQFEPYETGAVWNATVTDLHVQAGNDALKGYIAMPKDVYFFCTDKAWKEHSFFQGLKIFGVYRNVVFMKEH